MASRRHEPKAVVGVDGCRAGWFAVMLEPRGRWRAEVFGDVGELAAQWGRGTLVLMDIPIGLREHDPRERLCDTGARGFLGWPRRASVFAPPCRATLQARSYRQALAVNRRHTGRGLSCQSWNIASKIREVDEFLTRRPAGLHVREFHPEVGFAGLAGGRAMAHSKKTPAGLDERLGLLRQVCAQADEVFEHALEAWPRQILARDDILDALAGAVVARLGRRRLRTLPDSPETDARGLPMEIVYMLRNVSPEHGSRGSGLD